MRSRLSQRKAALAPDTCMGFSLQRLAVPRLRNFQLVVVIGRLKNEGLRGVFPSKSAVATTEIATLSGHQAPPVLHRISRRTLKRRRRHHGENLKAAARLSKKENGKPFKQASATSSGRT